MKWNPSGIVVAIAIPVAGYCFGGTIGLGVAAVIVALINIF
jgi:hypothetical protein